MGKALYSFWVDEEGQDLTEYTLLVGVMTLGAIGLFTMETPSVNTIWTSASTMTSRAATLSGS